MSERHRQLPGGVRGVDLRSVVALVLLAVAALALLVNVVVTRHGYAIPGGVSARFFSAVLVAYLVYAVVGAMILVRRPANTVGWILGAIGFFPLVGNLAGEYALHALAAPSRHWPLLAPALWLNAWYFAAAVGPLPLLFLLFPDGRPMSRRWRHVISLAVTGLAGFLFKGMLQPSDDPATPNPYAVRLPGGLVATLDPLISISLFAAFAGGLLSLVLRYRRAEGVERQQVAWLLYGVVLAVTLMMLNTYLPFDNWAFVAGFTMPGLGIGVAVLRYRLYDIDRLVSRTVSYTLLTVVLALAYVLVVTGASRLVGNNQVAVALATLVTAASFNPLRRRVQGRVDRRFNRSRYDAERTVEEFSRRMRGEVDLDAVRRDLVAVVGRTLQPTYADLWLRPGRGA